MARVIAFAALLALALTRAPHAQSTLVRSVIDEGRAMVYVRGLTALGPRLTGTEGFHRAAEWSATQLRAGGADRVVLEPFTIADGWERVRASARIVSPLDRTLDVAALGWTPSTHGEIAGDVVALTPDELAIDKISGRTSLAGRIVLLPLRDAAGSAATASSRRRELDVALRRAGVLAILSPEPDGSNELSARDRAFGAIVGALPAAEITRDDAAALRALIDRGAVRISMDLQNRVTTGPITVHNVIAELRGRELPDEWVLVGAHLDSWDLSEGAQDNATGAATVLEAARAIAAETRPRRSIRFALWGGEEQGQLGSTAYVHANAADLDR
jgi:hypothetical protein